MISPQELRHEGMCVWKFFHYNLKKYIKYHHSKEKNLQSDYQIELPDQMCHSRNFSQ